MPSPAPVAEEPPPPGPLAAPAPEAAAPGPPVPECCPACGGAGFRVLFRAGDRLYRMTDEVFNIVECRTCRLLRLSPRPGPGELRRFYPRAYWHVPEQDAAGRLAERYRAFVLRDHVRFVEKSLAGAGIDGPLLDIGCGGGLFAKRMRAMGRRALGLDFSIAAAGVAWEVNRVPVACASLAAAPFADNSFAVITMFHVLEHLYDPAAYLVSAHRLLKPEGRLILQVPNAACWQFLLLGEAWRGLEIPRHLWNFRTADLEILLDRCGFEIERVKHFTLRDNPACLATSLVPGLDPTVRKVRGTVESACLGLVKDLLYFCLVAACLPFTLVESACRAGCTVLMEARKKP